MPHVSDEVASIVLTGFAVRAEEALQAGPMPRPVRALLLTSPETRQHLHLLNAAMMAHRAQDAPSRLYRFGRADAPNACSWLTAVAQLNRKPSDLVAMLVEEVRRQRVLLPTPRVLELIRSMSAPRHFC